MPLCRTKQYVDANDRASVLESRSCIGESSRLYSPKRVRRRNFCKISKVVYYRYRVFYE